MRKDEFLNKQMKHLHNKKDAVLESIQAYGQSMPDEHKLFKIGLLQQIEVAIQKIKTGQVYGLCEECSEEIEQKRLAHLPEATYCIACQTEKEREVKRRSTHERLSQRIEATMGRWY